MRSGTLQYLHISEFGTICANFPDKAREIVTGALNTVETGQFTVIESTAEGQEGALPGLCQEAQARHNENLTPMDFKFHFFPWFQDKNYVLNGLGMPPIPDEDTAYFDNLENELGIVLFRGNSGPGTSRRAYTQGGDMRREYPSTPDEAFEQALRRRLLGKGTFRSPRNSGNIAVFPVCGKRTQSTRFGMLGRNDDNGDLAASICRRLQPLRRLL